MSDKQPEALYLAEILENATGPSFTRSEREAIATELRRLHAENTALKAQVAPQRQEQDDKPTGPWSLLNPTAKALCPAHVIAVDEAVEAAARRNPFVTISRLRKRVDKLIQQRDHYKAKCERYAKAIRARSGDGN